MTIDKPAARPGNPRFSSGPTAKRPGWTPSVLDNAVLGRSHRSPVGASRLNRLIEETRTLLDVPEGYKVAIVPASDTGAMEMAMWSLLGARGVDVLAWESFGKGWVTDITKQLRLEDVRVLEADYGDLPDLGAVDGDRDVVFAWNGTTSGVRVPNGDWIAADRTGLTICDATSAVFAHALPLDKLDVITFSWQKVLGGEAQHGMLVLSPRAVERLEAYTPPWPMPKLFRLTKGGKLIEGLFRGATINTPSMLAVEDCLDALEWARSVGGGPGLIERAEANAAVLAGWVSHTPWIDYLAADPAIRSNSSVCLTITDPQIRALSAEAQRDFSVGIAALLEAEDVAYDIAAYRDAPPGLRIWCGATVDAGDVAALTPWLEWAYQVQKAQWRKVA